MIKTKEGKIILVVALVAMILLSVFGLSRLFTSPDIVNIFMNELDEKQEDVLAFLAVSSVASVGISAIPSDVTTPIAQAIMDLSGYLIIIMTVIFVEKYILIIAGYAMAYAIIPASCIVGIVNIFMDKTKALQIINTFTKKILILGLAILLVVPSAIGINKVIEFASEAAGIEVADVEEIESYEDQGFWEKLKQSTSEGVEKAKSVLNDFIENIAVMIITSCLVPILAMLILLFVIKTLFNINYPQVDLKLSKRIKKKAKAEDISEGEQPMAVEE